MSLVAGSRLGPYEILGQIGAGGMGEVYRAKDSRLSREVAIKVLPATFSQDEDRLRRFEQEAKAAGVLNHPNITAVYDIGASAADGAPYVVQELLEGETLRAALAGGRIAQRRTLDYATQIALGLAAAHEKGIVHRDLKPENLFVTKDGRVKILDFGLAKLTQNDSAVSSATNLPDRNARHGARRRARNARLHVARAGPRQARRRAQRHLFLRGDPLRNALGQEGVPRRFRRRHDVRDPAGGSGGSLRHQPEHLPRSRADRPPLDREESRAAVPVGARSRLQSGGGLRDVDADRLGARPSEASTPPAGRTSPAGSPSRRGSGLPGHADFSPSGFGGPADLQADHEHLGVRGVSDALAGRANGGVPEPRSRDDRHLGPARRKPSADQPHRRLQARELHSRLLARRRPHRLSVALRRRRDLRHGRDRRERAASDERRQQPGLVARREGDRLRDRAGHPAVRPHIDQRALGRRGRHGQVAQSPRRGRCSAERLAARSADRVLGPPHRRQSAGHLDDSLQGSRCR